MCSPMRVAGALLAGIVTALPCHADSFGVSSASSAGSASIGSISGSLRGSSRSSSPDNDDVAEGEYRVIDVAEAAGRPELRVLHLQHAARADAAGELWLELPVQALGARALAAGDRVRARKRSYGLEFAHADTREPFFLVLADDRHRELGSQRVTF